MHMEHKLQTGLHKVLTRPTSALSSGVPRVGLRGHGQRGRGLWPRRALAESRFQDTVELGCFDMHSAFWSWPSPQEIQDLVGKDSSGRYIAEGLQGLTPDPSAGERPIMHSRSNTLQSTEKILQSTSPTLRCRGAGSSCHRTGSELHWQGYCR